MTDGAASQDLYFPGTPWPDHRPVGRLDCAIEGEREADPQGNPRGWHSTFHAGLDARSADYAPRFAERWRGFFTQGCVRVKGMRGQGIVLLDGEGRRYPQPTSYLGNFATARPPEMTDELVYWMAAEAERHGLWIGFTVRHTVPVATANGNVRQVPAGPFADALLWNVQETRWLLRDKAGVYKYVYYDSSNEYDAWARGKGPRPVSATVLRRLQEGVPGLLVQTEWGSLAPFPAWGMASYRNVPRVAPWREAAYPAHPGTLAAAPGHFEIVMPTPGWEPSASDEARLVAEAGAGAAVFMFAASWDHPLNQWVSRVYARAAGLPEGATPRPAAPTSRPPAGETVPSRVWEATRATGARPAAEGGGRGE